jgi:hypothetical protein
MSKASYFQNAMAAGEYKRRAWVISAFSLIHEGPEDWKVEPYAYRIVQTPVGHFYVNPEDPTSLLPIPQTKPGEPPFKIKDRVQLKKGTLVNLDRDVETTYGNWFYNELNLCYPFGSKIPYLEGRISPSQIEGLILPRLKSNKDPIAQQWSGEGRDPQWIYVDEYLRFADAMFSTVGFTQLCVPAATAKSMVAAPGIVQLKAKLLAENKDRLNDPAVIAKIQAELVQFDKDYLKGDPSSDFLITKKAFQVVRSKLFGMHGGETGFSESIEVDLIENSLSQGWNIDQMPLMIDAQRQGSFFRGAQTVLGGESVKWLLRASSNLSVVQEDCGTKLGLPMKVDGVNIGSLLGEAVVVDGKTSKVTRENQGEYLGKALLVRSPTFCKLPKTDFCAYCIGAQLAENVTGLSSAVTQIGSIFMDIYMQAVHGKQLTVAPMDFKTAFL